MVHYDDAATAARAALLHADPAGCHGEPDADAALGVLAERGVPAWACGTVRARQPGESGDAAAKGGSGGAVSLVGRHA